MTLECRHELWAVALREVIDGKRDGGPAWAMQAALDRITELEDEPSVDEFIDGLGLQRVLTESDVADLMEEYRSLAPDPDFLPGWLEKWLAEGES